MDKTPPTRMLHKEMKKQAKRDREEQEKAYPTIEEVIKALETYE